MTIRPPRAHRLSQGYGRFFGFPVPRRQPHRRYEISEGFLMSTAEDMAHLFAPVEGHGMGWFITPGHIFHGGANETFKTFVDLYPGRGLVIVFSQLRRFFGDRFIWTTQVVQMWRVLPDVGMLMIVGSMPDYAQGLIKLSWLMRGRGDADESLARP